MPNHTWTAEEVHSLVKDWPREAWPTVIDITYDRNGWYEDMVLPHRPVSPSHAASLFVASGLEWLINQERFLDVVLMGGCEDDENGIGVRVTYTHTDEEIYECNYPTLLHAISAAIMAGKEKE